MLSRKVSIVYNCGRRRISPRSYILLTLAISLMLFFKTLVVLDSPSAEADLSHFRRSRDLHHYLDEIQDPLIEPSSTPCMEGQEVPVVVLVPSAPSGVARRASIRNTWAQELPTFFILGLEKEGVDEQMINSYMEAKQYSDLVVFDFHDVYQNLTLKTALMLRWSLRRCPQAEFVLKADDDVLVNPWTLRDIIRDNEGAKVLGHKHNVMYPIRDPNSKWYLPEWLYPEETVPQYVAGPGYLINGDILPKLLVQAYREPLINLEDVYFTYLVAHKSLGYNLTHDKRVYSYRPTFPFTCGYFVYAVIHDLSPEKIVDVWPKIKALGEEGERGSEVCALYKRLMNWFGGGDEVKK